MDEWPKIPDDVISWFRSVFYKANRSVTEQLLNSPNIRETSLDDGLVHAIHRQAAPRKFASGAVVEMQVHNIGGLRRVGPWETADIAVLVAIYEDGRLVDQKIGLLQSKRLYPLSGEVIDEDPAGFMYGLNAFLRRDPHSALGKIDRLFKFDDTSRYGALKKGDGQSHVIANLNKRFGEAVYYMFYNPPDLPTEIQLPQESYLNAPRPRLATRVHRAAEVEAALADLKGGQAPSIGQINAKSASNWRLEGWAELLLRCKVGKRFDETMDTLIGTLLERRTGPIAAAISVSVALPPRPR